MKLHVSLLLLAGVLSAICVADQETEVEGSIEKFVNDVAVGDLGRHSKVRRDVTSLITSINIPALVSTLVGLIKQALSYLKCCEPVTVPAALVSGMSDCVQHPASSFIADISNTMASRESTDMVQPPVYGSQLCSLIEGELCTAKCALGKLKMLAADGLPSPDVIIPVLPSIATADQISVLKPAVIACGEEMKKDLAGNTNITESEKCWASNAMLTCLQRQIYEVCPDNKKLTGAVCVKQLGRSLIRDLPTKFREAFNQIVSKFNSILKPGV